MSTNENIKTRFLNFEGEANQEAIEQSWEQIKYFLPREKKHRFAFFKKVGIGLLLFFLSGLITLPYLLQKQPEVVASQTQSNSAPVLNHTPTSPVAKDPVGKVAGSTISSEIKNITYSPVKPTAGIRSAINNSGKNYNDAGKDDTTEEKIFISKDEEKTFILNSQEQRIPNENSNDKTIALIARQESVYANDSVPEPAEMDRDSVPFVVLQPVVIDKINDETVNELWLTNSSEKVLFEPWKNNISAEVFGGLTRFASTINSDKITGTTYATGVGIYHQFKRKLFVHAQFIYAGKGATQQATETNTMLVQKQPNTIATSSLMPDTLYSFRKVYTDKTIETLQSYNISVGVGYSLYKRNKVSVNALVMVNVRSTKYRYSVKNSFDAELSYYKQYKGDPPPNNFVTKIAAETTETKQLRVIGMTSGMLLSYDITSKVSLIVKPMFQFDLSGKNVLFNSITFNQKQNNLFMVGGLRIIL